MPNSITAIIVNWNAGENLAQCVTALINQHGIDLNVIVVDNASSDNSLETLETYGNRVRVIQTGENLGFGRAVNRGVAASHSAIVIALNPDVVLQPDAGTGDGRIFEHTRQCGHGRAKAERRGWTGDRLLR